MSRRILITDDHPIAAERFAWLFEGFDYQIRVAMDGLQTIAIAEAFRPDVVLIDVDSATTNGFETAKHIRDQAWCRDMVLIAISADWDKQHEQRSREAGFAGHLIKPATMEEFVDAIEKCARSKC